jgi:Ca-activated chloride channel family protein
MDFAHPHFAEPGWLWLAVLGPAGVVVLQHLAARARRKQLAAFAASALWDQLLQSHSPARRAIKDALVVLAVALFGLALARPQWGEQPEFVQAMGEDILFVLDCSRSMLAEDVRPNRLERAKLAILDFVQRHGRGRVGLVAFAGQAFLQCPLTFDYDAFREALMAVDDKTIPVPGTDIGRALDEAARAMEKTSRRKVMVLVTDGEDLEQAGVQTAQQLAEQRVVVFAIGVGTPLGATIQYLNEQGVPQVVRDRQGNPVQSRLDEKTLRAIAEATGGSYQPLGHLGEGMARVRLALETGAYLPGAGKMRKLGVDRFHVPVAALVLLLVSESLIGTRRRASETLQQVNYEQPKAA